MLSTTSSSESRPPRRKVAPEIVADRLPGGPWGRIWIAALVAAALLLATWEGLLRARGFRPSIAESTAGGPETWAVARSLVGAASSRTILVLGASRAEHGIAADALARRTGTPHPIYLTVTGASVRPMLHDLAIDPTVRNPILYVVDPVLFFDASRSTEKRSEEWMRQWRAMTTCQIIEQWLREQVAGSLAMRHRILAPSRILYALRDGAFPTPQYFVVRPDRSVEADHARFHPFPLVPKGIETLEQWRAFGAQWFDTHCTQPSAAALQRLIEETRADVARIEARGGRVIFLRMPSSGDTLRAEEKRFSRAAMWDVFAREVGAPCIYFQDYPALDLPCGDDSHMDYAQAVPFTEALGDLLAPLLRDRSAMPVPPASAKTPPLPRD